MTATQWEQVWLLFKQVSDIPASHQRALLESGTNDKEVIAQVLTLLSETSQPAIPPSSPSRTGTRIAHYEVNEMIGCGGMGEVYSATDLALERTVAIKFLPAHVL